MSNILPPLTIPWTHRRNDSSSSNISLPPLSSWSDGRRALSSISSSPPPSSSPPMTPFSSRSSHNHTFIRSSPTSDYEVAHHTSEDHISELISPWDRHYQPYSTNKQPNKYPTFPGLKSVLSDDDLHSSLKYLDASTSSRHVGSFYNEHHSNKHDDVTPRYGSVFYDTEEEEDQDKDDGYTFEEEDSRATFFRTSAERGQWRYDPTALKAEPYPHMRQSAPTSSRPPFSNIQLPSRPISEPAPSASRLSSPADMLDSHNDYIVSEVLSTSFVDHGLPDRFSPAAHDASSSLPSLTSDRESIELEETHCPSSSLPPSSPPVTPLSLPTSPIMRSISPLSFAPSSPLPVVSSPLSFASSLDHEEENMDIHITSGADTIPTHDQSVPPIETNTLSIPEPTLEIESKQDPDEVKSPLMSTIIPPEPPITNAPLSTMPPECNTVDTIDNSATREMVSTVSSFPIPEIPIPDLSPHAEDEEVDEKDEKTGSAGLVGPSVEIGDAIIVEVENTDISIPPVKRDSKASNGEVKVQKLRDMNGVVGSDSTDEASSSRLKEKRRKPTERRDEGPIRKKSRLTDGDSVEKKVTSGKKFVRRDGKRKLEEGEMMQEEEDDTKSHSASKNKKQKKSDTETTPAGSRQPRSQQHTDSHTHSTSTSSSSKLPVSEKSRGTSANSKPKLRPKGVDPETQALDAEICGMLIESMATSRASCLPVSTLYKAVMQCRPSLKAQRNEKEWMEVFQRVLQNGEASRGSGVFGKVESSGKDEADRPLEAQWFYVPELDDDQERATLIKSMMPRPGKRTETKKYKQYYYRPLDKISRWDPEDEI